MVAGDEVRVSRRPVPGTALSVSSIGLALDPVGAGNPTFDQRTVATLRSARSRGVTAFEVVEGAGSLRAERLLGQAFPSADPDLVVILGRSVSSLAEERTRGSPASPQDVLEHRLRSSVLESATRIGPLPVGLIAWRHEPESGVTLADVTDALERLRSTGLFAGWALSATDDGTLPEAAAAGTAARPELFTGAFSPLEPGLLGSLGERASRGPVGFFARDPLGSGRLDGTRFAESIADRRPDARPLNVRELRREFDPVLRLGFLTEGHRRTLAQASLQFVLRWPWVCAALVPLPSPERLDELLRAETTPPLSEGEVDRLLARSP